MAPKIHLLLVEPDPDDVLFVQQAMAIAAPDRVEFEVASDADEAERLLAAIAKQDASRALPRLVMMDPRLPGRSGFEVLVWMRQQPGLRGIPVIILSDSSDPSEVARAHELGANSYLPKDMDLGQLDRVAKALVAYAELVAATRNDPERGTDEPAWWHEPAAPRPDDA